MRQSVKPTGPERLLAPSTFAGITVALVGYCPRPPVLDRYQPRDTSERFAPSTFAGITVALVGYCPRPPVLDRYQPRDTSEQYFIHVPPASVQICSHAGISFLSIVHVYGGPVSAALIEELAYYGVTDVLAYGLAGGLGVEGQQLGDYYLVERALVADSTSPHYTAEPVVAADPALNALITAQARAAGLPALHPVQALTDDAIYIVDPRNCTIKGARVR